MRIIKQAAKQETYADVFVAIGDIVKYQPKANPDGRGGYDLPRAIQMTVVKVNKFTFDAEDKNGTIYRLDIREDRFQVKHTAL